MSMQPLNMEFNTFVGGILTEANPINYPVGYTLDEQNFILERNGTRTRRRGIANEQYSDLTNLVGLDMTSFFSGYYLWENASGTGQNLLVLWSGSILKAFRIDPITVVMGFWAYTDSISNQVKTMTTPLTKNITAVTSHDNKLVVSTVSTTSTYPNSFIGAITVMSTPVVNIISYDGTNLITENAGLILEVRDFYTPEDTSIASNVRPAVATDTHNKWLASAGWTFANLAAFKAANAGNSPSRQDDMNSGIDTAGVFTPGWLDGIHLGNQSKGIGSLIINPFCPVQGREYWTEELLHLAIAGGGLSSPGRIVKILSAYGRVFYLCDALSSSSDALYQTFLGISQTVTSNADYVKCYQKNDPNSNLAPDLLDTDGALFSMTDIGNPLGLLKSSRGVMIFGTKKVVELIVTGDVFQTTGLTFKTITEICPESFNSVVIAGVDIFYVAKEGVIKLAYDANYNSYSPQNISKNKIASLLRKYYSDSFRGTYAEDTQTLHWTFSNSGSTLASDFELIYDTVLDSFYKFSYGQKKLFHPIYTKRRSNPIGVGNVLSRGLFYLGYASSQLAILVPQRDILQGPSFNPNTTKFQDFTGDGDALYNEAFIQTGYITGGDSQRMKQCQYIIPSFLRTEDGFIDDGSGNLSPKSPSKCTIQAWWDYADENSIAKVNPAFEAYRYNREYIPSGPSDTFDYGQTVLTTKNKVTGRGRALSLRFSSTDEYACRLLGWGLGFESNTKV